jgi:hypothetical protein
VVPLLILRTRWLWSGMSELGFGPIAPAHGGVARGLKCESAWVLDRRRLRPHRSGFLVHAPGRVIERRSSDLRRS